MSAQTGIRRVIVVVLDGLRPDAVDAYDLSNVRDLARRGASTMSARTVSPSCTWPVMTSLMCGVSPDNHGVLTDSVHVPNPKARLYPLPALLRRAGYPTSAFMRGVPTLYRATARLIAKGLGFAEAGFAGSTAHEVLASATEILRKQQRGLIVIHWPDADDAGESHGWMSREYEDACRELDSALGALVERTSVVEDPNTLLVALADHGGGGVIANEHSQEHPLNWTIPLMLAGGAVRRTSLDGAHLLDVPPTIASVLGVSVPSAYSGRVLVEALESERELAEVIAVA